MPTYIGENKIVDRYLGDKFLEAAYIGDEKVYDPYIEITGYLPIIFNSRAAVALKNYRIYGTANGAGVATENLYNPNDVMENTRYYWETGNTFKAEGWTLSNLISVQANKQYIPIVFETLPPDNNLFVSAYDSNGGYIGTCRNGSWITDSGSKMNNIAFTTPLNCAFVKILTQGLDVSKLVLSPGSTAPASYIPPGYKIPISNSDGTNTSNYDLFVGDSKLYEDEYLDFVEQKIYRTILLTTHDNKDFITSDNKRFCVRRSNNG